jgi:hypothetical protein
MITATVTRPTTISPTITCDRKIYFVERIDISPLYPPKSRTITLEPVSRRKVAKEHAKKLVDPTDRKSRKTDSASRSDPQRNSNSTAPSTGTDSEPPMSPSPSHMSYESAVSGSNAQSQRDSSSQSQSTSADTTPNDSKGSVAVKNITTEVESCVGGCLRGDSIPVKVSVNHVKHIKSMNGVIVTLYRQARVDMHPAIPLGPTEKCKNPKYEDYYPRSKTGLGGLSLSGAGSSHMFRKDLSQTVQPLIVDPGSLLSEVTVKVRVPEDAFPTISTVPGAMISFKYYVEVVVDIQGRLGAQERAMAGLTGLTSMAMSGGDDLENERGGMTASGAFMVDTAPVRRDKGVVSATFEVVIGTRDSERRKGKQKEEETPVIPEEPPVVEPCQHDEPTNGGAEQHYSSHPSEDDYWGYNYYDWTNGNPNRYDHWDYHGNGWEAPPQIPMPHVPDDSHLSEKERARRAEERLLPSQPPGMDQQAGEDSHAATAPYLPGENVPGLYGAPTPAYESHLPSPSVPANAALQTPLNDTSAPAPGYFPVAGSSNHMPITVHVDDKQEMRRRQLEAEASAPPEDDEDLYAGSDAPSSGTATVHQASAPSAPEQIPRSPDEDGDDTLVPNESDLNHDSHAEATEESDLPRYEPKSPASSVDPQLQQQRPESAASHAAAATPVVPMATETISTTTDGQSHSHDA